MKEKEMVCTGCPMGCNLKVEETDCDGELQFVVSGNSCRVGENYGVKECTNPTRGVTTYVKVIGGQESTVSVKTDKEIPKDKIFQVIRLLKDVTVSAPVTIGDKILKNIFDSGVNIIATKNVEKS